MPFDPSKPFKVIGEDAGTNIVPNLLPPASYQPDITDRIADAAERGYKFYRQSELINKPLTRESADEVARLQREIEDIPPNPALVKFQQAQGWKAALGAIADDPIETISGLMAESLGSLIPKAIKTVPAHMLAGGAAGFALGGPAGALIGARAGSITGTGVTSYSLEYAGKVLESLREEGVDIKDPGQLYAAFTTPELIDGIKAKAVRKGVPIAVFDALSAGLAGKFLSKPAASMAGRFGQGVAEVGQQMVLGGAGELAGEVSAGEKISPPAILSEMLLETVSGGPEIVTGTVTRKTRPLGERTRNASAVRSDQTQLPSEGQVGQTSQAPSRDDVQQAAPVQPQPVATREATQAPSQEKIAPVTFLQVQQGMPELAWYRIEGDVVSPDGRVYTKGKNISNGELARFGYTIPEPELAKYQAALQGERRSPQEATVEGRQPVPVAPPAIQFTGLSIPVEQVTIAERIKDKVTEENVAAPGLPIRNINIVKSGPTDPAIYTVPSSGGFDTVNVDLEKLGRSLQAEGLDIDQYLALATNEEIIHNAAGAVAHDRWVKFGREKAAFPEFYRRQMNVIHEEMTPEQRVQVRQVYGVAGLDMAPERVAEEHLRMLVQGRLKGGITEQTIGTQTLDFLKALFKRLMEILGVTRDAQKQQIIRGYADAVQAVIQQAEARAPGERFESGAEPTGTTEPTPQEESPFDRMRRESGAEPAPELTPEEQAAKERNERRRNMRPNPRFAGAIDPAAQLAMENDDDLFIETQVMGVTDTVNGRPMNTQASTDASKVWAGERIKEAGLDAVRDDAVGGWRFTGGENHEGGRRLVQIIEREFAVPDSPDRDNATLLASLINSVRVNYDAGVLDNIVDEATGIRLYALTQGEASHRGRALQALAMHPVTIELVGRHVPAHLQKVYSNAFGGEVIEGVMADIRKGTQAFMTRPLIEHVLAQNPRLQNALDLATAIEEKALPDAIELIQQVFQVPFYKLSDFGKALERRLIKEYGVDPKSAATIAKEFQAAFDPSLKQGANEALKIATANITFEKKAKVKGKKPIEKLVQDAINKGALESGQVLRDIAKQQGWNPPSDAEIDRMKRLADRLTELRQLPAATLAEMRKTNASEADIENARAVREAGLSSEINRIRKELEIAWARMTKPINFFLGLPFFGDPTIRANNARAINEFIAANLLSKPGFFTRQVAAILSQWLSFVPTRSIANAIVNNQHAKDWKERQPFIKEVAGQLRDGYKQQFAAMKSAIAGAQAGLLGRGEQRTVLNLTSALSALDRLTKQAEERWAAGDYGRASLLYFLSSIKMGYRIAQGLDRLQGVPAHYQNMRAQIVRALMDKGKTRAEADTSADLVLGDMKGQWMLATARARDLLVEAGVEPTAQKIRQNAAQIVKRWAYQKVATLGLDADAFEAENTYMENTLGWNQREVKGLGGALARGLRQAERVAESYGIPLVATRFSNAIGITINRSLAYTPLWKQANVGGPGDSAWFKSEVDRAQRRVEAIVGTSVGAIALMMALTGTWAVRLRWPKDKEERDIFEREGHRPNTVEVPIGETEFLAISLNNSPLMFVAPYLAAGAALREKLEEKAKLQATRDKQAAELGVTAEKVPGLSAADLGLVAIAAAQQSVLGGRTVAGLIGSMSSYGDPSAKKTIASYTSAMIPWLPAAQEGSRMAGVALDEKAASIGDLMLPLPTSGARKLNLLGDPVRTPNDIQRISQILTGGTSLVPVNAADARSEPAYRALLESGFRPPSVSPGQGYLIDGTIRPMNASELQRYTAARGARLKEALAGFSATGDTEADKKQARQLYQAANTQALTEIGAATIPRYSSSAASPPSLPKPRATRPRSGLRRTRGVRIRSARVRRIRPLRTRRIRRTRSVRLAA